MGVGRGVRKVEEAEGGGRGEAGGGGRGKKRKGWGWGGGRCTKGEGGGKDAVTLSRFIKFVTGLIFYCRFASSSWFIRVLGSGFENRKEVPSQQKRN